MTKKITVPEEYQFRPNGRPLSDTEKLLFEKLNHLTASAYRAGYTAGYRECGILAKLKRRLIRK